MHKKTNWISTIAVREHLFWLIKEGLLLNLPVAPGSMMTPGVLICFEMEEDGVATTDRNYCYATITQASPFVGLGANLTNVKQTLIAFRIHETLDDLYVS